MSEGIYWIKPIITDGVVRWPACEATVTDPMTMRYRDDDDVDCYLTAKVNYRGKMLCKRHAAKLILNEYVKHE